jgi:O-antigen ligase
MTVFRIREREAIRPLHVVLICLVVLTVGGGSLLLSAAESKTLVDGAIEWQAESPLRAVVQLLCLNYKFPTIHAGAVKIYLLGLGAGLTVIALSVAVAARGRENEEEGSPDESIIEPAGATETETTPGPHKVHIAPLIAAQALIGLYLLWSFASSRWSAAPKLAVGGSVLLTIHALWAFGLGNGLSASAARIASRIVVIVTAVTALVALWYYYGRNPTIRAKFPFGNPTFLSACLIPGLLLAATLACERVSLVFRTRSARSVAVAVAALLVLTVGLWAFFLTGSRGPVVGLAFGILAIVFFAIRRWWKSVPAIFALAVLIAGSLYGLSAMDQASPTGRDATLRVRMYAWTYAWRMFDDKPFTGHGQGGFVLAGDSYALHDVLNDPKPLESRLAHAHSEWLEVMADLGSVGIVLIAAALVLTLRAGALALDSLPSVGQRWVLLGLMGALVGLVVEEAFGVGLRVTGVGNLFYTVIGLIWALSAHQLRGVVAGLSATRGRRAATGIIGSLVGLATLVLVQQDFAAARSTFRAGEALASGAYEEAIDLATAARSRLNPQRALTNLSRLAEAHLRVAQKLHHRAADRQARAHAAALPDSQLLELAQVDFIASDEHCTQGTAAVLELVSCSPGFFNHGWLESLLHLTLARNATARGDTTKRDRSLSAAATAIERELARQPFNASITLDFVRIAGPGLEPKQTIHLLARPLRHQGITRDYVDLLGQLAADPEFDSQLESIVQDTKAALTSPPVASADRPAEAWAPEKLRLVATVRFMRGEYDRACENLELAATAYDALAGSAPLGAASCYADLAGCRFFNRPDDPKSALEAASRAMALTPESLAGRQLREKLARRMIHYHLAAGEEEAALELLRHSAPTGTATDAVMRELALCYRSVSESLLQRREAGVLRKPPDSELLSRLRRWVARSIELNPNDPFSHYLAADLTFQAGDDEATATHLRQALDLDLQPQAVIQFLQVALDEKPESTSLKALRNELQPERPSDVTNLDKPPETKEHPAPAIDEHP